MASAIFWPTQQTNQSPLVANLFNFCFFHPIWVKFVMGVTLGREQHRMFFEMATAIF